MSPVKYDMVMAEINAALKIENGKKPDLAYIKSIILSSQCPYLKALLHDFTETQTTSRDSGII